MLLTAQGHFLMELTFQISQDLLEYMEHLPTTKTQLFLIGIHFLTWILLISQIKFFFR